MLRLLPTGLNENWRVSPPTLSNARPFPTFLARRETAGSGGGCAPFVADTCSLPNIMVTAV
jgi:hypothetical protein